MFFSLKKNDRHRDVKKGQPRERVERQYDVKEVLPRLHVVLQEPIYAIQKEVIYTSANQTFPAYANDLNMTNTYASVNSLGRYGQGSHYSGIRAPQNSLMGPTVPPPTQVYIETDTSSVGSDTDHYSD